MVLVLTATSGEEARWLLEIQKWIVLADVFLERVSSLQKPFLPVNLLTTIAQVPK